MAPLIAAHNLSFRYDDGTPALNGIDFELHARETVALLGANGSGKTTFVLNLTGLLQGEGDIQICGLRLEKKNLAAIRRKIGVVFQDSDTQLFMPTVLEDVAFAPLNHGISASEAVARAKAALDQVGLPAAASRAPYHLSAGEKKRVAIAGILATDPEILVFDEPTTFLDPPAQRSLIALLRQLPQAKLVVTHDIAFAGAIASRAVFFERGRIAADDTVSEIARRFDWRVAST